MKLDQRVVIVIGAGQTPGETIGNGRAASILFAREGAPLLLVDNSTRWLTAMQYHLENQLISIRIRPTGFKDCRGQFLCKWLFDNRNEFKGSRFLVNFDSFRTGTS